MGALADWLARRLWYGMLWLMRRRWMRRLQNASINLWPKRIRPRMRESYLRQNQFARRYGLKVLRFSIFLLLASLALTLTLIIVLRLYDEGFLYPPSPSGR